MGSLKVDTRPNLDTLVNRYIGKANTEESVEWPYWLKSVLFEARLVHAKNSGSLGSVKKYLDGLHDSLKGSAADGGMDDSMLLFSVRLLDSVWGGFYGQTDLYMCRYYSDRGCPFCCSVRRCSQFALWITPDVGEAGRLSRFARYLELFVQEMDDDAANILGLEEFGK